MKHLISTLFFLILLHAAGIGQFNHIQLNGQDYHINGINLPWNNFGWDFGKHDEWGTGYDTLFFETAFSELAEQHVNCVRIWIHCDGRANPNFNNNGFVTGLDEGMLAQLNDFVERAGKYQLMLILTLWSHDMFEDYTDVAGPHAGLHSTLVTNAAKTDSYLEQALIPMAKSLANHCNILAWEIINEPEWAMQIPDGNSTAQTVSATDMQKFIGRCIQAIRQHTAHYVTVGAALPFGNTAQHHTNYWHESQFDQLGFDCSQVYLDFYSFHYYDWMQDDCSPFEQAANTWALGRPIIIAETASRSDALPDGQTPLGQLSTSFEKGYAGTLFWSYNAGDEYSDWENCKAALAHFGEVHSDLVNFEPCDTMQGALPALICDIYPNPTASYVNIAVHHFGSIGYNLYASIRDASGRLVRKSKLVGEATQFDVQDLSAGWYQVDLQILGKNAELIQVNSYRLVVL